MKAINKTKLGKSGAGFTLIELLVVIAVISLLASVVLVALNATRSKARDARRRADLSQVTKALELYYDKYNTYRVSGYGWMGGGEGYFSGEDGVSYPKSVARGLVDAGFISNPLLDDPDPAKKGNYMIYLCNGGQSYSLSATLENPTAEDISHIQTVCNGVGANGVYTFYGKNFALP